MVRLAEAAFDDGAYGLSTGLEYWPGNEAPEHEIETLAAVAARGGARYGTHVRNRDVDCEASFAEAIRTAGTAARACRSRTSLPSSFDAAFGSSPITWMTAARTPTPAWTSARWAGAIWPSPPSTRRSTA